MKRSGLVWVALAATFLPLNACGDEATNAPDASTGGSAGAAGAAGSAGASGTGGDDAGDGAPSEPCPTSAVTAWPSAPAPTSVTPPPADPGCGPLSTPAAALRRRPYLEAMHPSGGRVTWTARAGSAGTVRVSRSPGGPWQTFPAEVEFFPTSYTEDTEDYVAFSTPLAGLEPGTAYCYEVLVDGEAMLTGLTLETAFTDPTRALRVLTFGDSGSGTDDQRAVRDRFLGKRFDLFLHLGDIAYGKGTFVEFETRHFQVYQDFLHRVPTFPALGNHEYGTPRARPYLDVFHLPEQALAPEDRERYYSFDYGDVHVVVLDSNDEMLIPIQLDLTKQRTDDMLDWLRADLAASRARWKIAAFHHPPFTSSTRGPRVRRVIDTILPELEAGGVDLVLVGHDHHYERVHPMRGECELPGGRTAIPYVIVGSGGAGIRDAEAVHPFTAFKVGRTYGHLELTIEGCRARGEFITSAGVTLDTFEVDGCRPEP